MWRCPPRPPPPTARCALLQHIPEAGASILHSGLKKKQDRDQARVTLSLLGGGSQAKSLKGRHQRQSSLGAGSVHSFLVADVEYGLTILIKVLWGWGGGENVFNSAHAARPTLVFPSEQLGWKRRSLWQGVCGVFVLYQRYSRRGSYCLVSS